MASLVLGQQLEQVYSLLEASQWKTALKILDQIVAKKSFKGNAEVRVLRAIALQRLGRGSEALEICADIRKDKAILSDSNVLTLASNVYRWERRPAELGSMYEDACAANPGNMHLLQEAFRANMSAFNFVKQQQIAMKLNRGAPSDKHFWWVVMSVLLQARNAGMAARRDQAAPAGPGAQQLLKLADGMISKHLGRAASLSADQLLVAVHVLRAMDRPGDALDHLRSEVGRNALPLDHERIGLEAVLLEDCGDYPSAAASYLTLLDVDKDDFHAWLKYLDCMLPGGEPWRDVVQGGLDSLVSLSQADRRRSACDVSLEDAVAAVESAIARFEGGAEENNSGCRSVLLARTELAYRLHLMSEPGQRDGEQLANAMYAYFKGCSTVSSCASDLGRYCAEISSFPQAAQRLADRLEGDTKDPDLSGDMRQATNDLRARVCALRLRHELGCDGEDGDSLARHAHRLMDLYAAASPLSKDLDPRERGPAEDVALIAAGCLVDCYRPTVTDHANTGRLIQALLCLEAAIKKRPYSANLRIAAGSLMGILGSAEEAAKHFKRLDIKFIQNDSLAGHICLPTASSLSSLAEVQHLCRQEVALFDDHEGSAGDTLTIAYEHGTLSKVIEMVDFKERLEYSHARLVARQEGSISAISSIFTQRPDRQSLQAALEQAVGSSASPQANLHMEFNEDLTVRPSWLPPASCAPPHALLSWFSRERKSTAWWQEAGSSCAPLPASSSWRAECASTATLRNLVPRILLCALDTEYSTTSREVLQQALASLSQETWDGQCSVLTGVGVVQGYSHAVLTAALQGSASDSPEAATALANCLFAGLTTIKHACAVPVGAGSARDVGICGALASQEMVWAAIALEALARRLGLAAPAGKKGKAMKSLPEGRRGGCDAVQATCQEVSRVCKEAVVLIDQVCAEMRSKQACSRIVGTVESELPGASLWAWELDKKQVENRVRAILDGQASCLDVARKYVGTIGTNLGQLK